MEHFYGCHHCTLKAAVLHRTAEHPEQLKHPDACHDARMQHMRNAPSPRCSSRTWPRSWWTHTTRRLRNCADRIARDTMGDDEDGVAMVAEAPLRPNPVTQDEMDAGSVELF